MTGGEGAAQWPAWRDRGEGHEDEGAAFKLGVRNGQRARGKPAAAPQGNVEIEHPRSPALAGAPSEIALYGLEVAKQLARLERGFNKSDAIGEVAAGEAMGVIEQDRRRVEQRKFALEPVDRGRNYLGRAAITAMSPVGPDGDGVEVICLRHRGGPRSAQ